MCIKNEQIALDTHYTNYCTEHGTYEIKLSCLCMCHEGMWGQQSASWADHIPNEHASGCTPHPLAQN